MTFPGASITSWQVSYRKWTFPRQIVGNSVVYMRTSAFSSKDSNDPHLSK